MKKAIISLFFAGALFLTPSALSAQACPDESILLDEVTLSCTQHHVQYSLAGFITYTFLITQCDNGEVYWDLV
ncbi:MAG: hypothetical protein ACK5SJ_02915 [Bacteroidota bacterium]|jgi:hypothetical protein|nr:hypothetical protein [Flammeovirgaceae bacterium]MCZ8069547.1 hypothetical protein [Cytophagales bacterium]